MSTEHGCLNQDCGDQWKIGNSTPSDGARTRATTVNMRATWGQQAALIRTFNAATRQHERAPTFSYQMGNAVWFNW